MRVHSMPLLLLLACARGALLHGPTTKMMRAPTAPRAVSPLMRSWTPADMKAKRLPLPDEVAALLSDDTSRENTEALYAALRSCFATEEQTIAAATRNTGTILPYLNSPSNIYGSYEVLVDMLGKSEASDVCLKNPGILQCNPITLRREDPEKIVSAANTVDAFEGVLGKLPPALRQNLDKVAFIVLALPVAKRLADCSGATCG